MTNDKQYFTTLEVLERAKEELEYRDHDDMVDAGDLHDVIANQDYYIIGTHGAIIALEEYGTWDAIGEVQNYEMEHFGEIYTRLDDPEKVANALWYTITDATIYDLNIDGLEVSEAITIINKELEHLNI